MAGKKLALALTIVTLSAASWYFVAQQKNGEAKPPHEEIAEKPPGDGNAVPPPATPPQNKPNIKSSADLAKMTAIQAEIANLTDEAIDQEIEAIKTRFKNSGLADKVKADQFDVDNDPRAKDMLVRMSLLRVEKNKRAKKLAADRKAP